MVAQLGIYVQTILCGYSGSLGLSGLLHSTFFTHKFNMNNSDKMVYKALWKLERQGGCLGLRCEMSGGPPALPPSLWDPRSSPMHSLLFTRTLRKCFDVSSFLFHVN